ncbi:protein EARLY FLOWERING 5-like [Cornus florida]|uniref:protein EARLY FLOWERING 5-like n=1 Tax=Cornus florida TaxID=4283 RepID=UPI00289BD14B|nr:protein EARLY FLOWERING 5-like [Cornus florida]
MKTTKGGKVMNPTDAYRKEIRKKELKRNKKERKKVREVGILKKDPDTLKEQIEKLEMMKAEGALDKARKHKKRQLEDTLNLVIKKRKEYEDKLREKGEAPVMFSHLGPPRRLTTAEEEERVKHPKPEDSVYYHPTLNPTGSPPPGKPPMFKSSIGPRIPLSAASSSAAALSSKSELEDGSSAGPPPPPPPPPPLPPADDLDAGDGSIMPESLPLPPPPPPMPPKPAVADLGTSMPPPLPPPPPGPPPKEQIAIRPPFPPSIIQNAQPPPPGTLGSEKEKNQSAKSDNSSSKEPVLASIMLPPPPPPPGLPSKLANQQSEGVPSESDAKNPSGVMDLPKMVPPPPPPRQQPPVPGSSLVPTLQPDVLHPGISRLPPPPPPPDMRPQLHALGLPGQVAPPGMMVPLIPRPPFGPPPMMRPPLPPGPPPISQDDHAARFPAPQKPSYVKSAASTVVKRPLAQHTPELTAMVPASVRVRRETAILKVKPKPSLSTVAAAATRPEATPAIVKPVSVNSSSAPKAQSIDDSYTAFLEDMKALGALGD